MRRRLQFRSWAAIAGAVLLLFAETAPAAAAAETTRQLGGVVWGGQVFTDADDLREWLEHRHRSYELWALRHPYAAAQLDPLDETPSRDDSRSLPMVGWAAIAAALTPAVLALGLAARPPTLSIARRRIPLAAFGFGVIAAGATAIVIAA